MLDTLSRIHQLDENNNGDMGFLIARLELLASTTGAAVLYVHHTSKSSARDGLLDQQQAARDASALIDNARWCGYLARMNEDQAKRFIDPQNSPAAIGADRRSAFLRLGVSKQNNNAAPLAQWLERQEDGALRPVCGWIDPGKQGSVELDTLCSYIWPDAANAEAMKKRRQVTRRALVELSNVGWSVEEYSKGKWMLRRPAKGRTQDVSADVNRSNVPPSPQ